MSHLVYLDNIIYNLQKYGGATTYWRGLQQYFIELEPVRIITQAKDPSIFDHQGKKYDRTHHNGKFILENFFPPVILRCLPFTKQLPAGSLYHASYYRACLQKDVVNILTVHDFTYKKGYASRSVKRLVHMLITNSVLKNADGIICISESTRNDLMHYFPETPGDKVRVIYHGVNEDFYPLEETDHAPIGGKVNLNDPYVIFIGKRRRYKNFDLVPEALKDVKDIKLIIVGDGDLAASEIRHLDRHIPGRYIKLDDVSNEELNILYNKAFALVYPSTHEGFGLPVLEAMRAGCPVIATALSSIPEVGGDAVLTMDEISPQSIARKLELLKNSGLRSTLIEKGFEQSKKFSWQKCFSETLTFYEDIHKQKFGG